MSGPKIVILVLVAVAVVFAVTVGVGSWPGRGRKFDPGSPNFKLENLKDTWLYGVLNDAFPSKFLDHARIDSEYFKCVFTIPKDPRGCAITIQKGDDSICDLRLKVTEGQATLTYVPNEGDEQALPIESRALEPNELFTLQISKKGGTLTLTNVTEPCCVIEIEK